MSTKESLLAGINANPEDDAARLVFADWCEDNGEPDRAEFIRAQIRLEEMPEYDPERFDLEERALDLLAAHRTEWLGDLPAWVRREPIAFRRGLPGEMRLSAGKFLSHGEKLVRTMPLVRLTLDGLKDRAADLAASEATELLELELTQVLRDEPQVRQFLGLFPGGRLRHLGLDGDASRAHLQFAALGEWPVLEQLSSLSLRRMRFTEWSLATFLGSERMGRLRRLELSTTGVDASACRDLAQQPRLAGLERLTLGLSADAEESVRALAAADWRALRSLNLTANDSAPALRDLTRAPWFAGLRSLDVAGSPVAEAVARVPPGMAHLGLDYGDGRAACAALFASDLAAGLTSLALRMPDGNVATDLAATPRLGRLTRLSFWSPHDDTDVLCDVLESPHLTALRELNVWHCRFTPEGEQRLPRLPGLSRLRSLGLANCWLTDQALAGLARSPHLNGLRRLDVSGSPFGTAGLKVLLQAPWLSSLRELRIASSQVNWVGIEALANCEAVANLRVLEFDQHCIGERTTRALVESPHLRRLLRLSLRGSRPLRAAVDRLRERFGGVLEVE